MKKVYNLINKHDGYVLYSSKTKSILQEILLDMFMESFQYDMQEAADSHWINPIEPSEDCRQYARDTWDSLMKWYNLCYDIQKVQLI